MPGTAAAKAGIQPGDVVTEFDGKIITDATALSVEAGLAGVGKSVPVKIFREGKYLTLRMTLEALNQEVAVIKKSELKSLEELGLSVATYKDQQIQGAKVVEVNPQSMAAMADIKKDDIIVKVNNQLIKDAASLAALVTQAPARAILRILMRRGHSTIFVVLQKP